MFFFFFSSRRRHTRLTCDWSSDVCSSDLASIRPAWPRLASALAHRRPDLLASSKRRVAEVYGTAGTCFRSEERRVGKEWRSGWSAYHYKKKDKLGDLDKIMCEEIMVIRVE